MKSKISLFGGIFPFAFIMGGWAIWGIPADLVVLLMDGVGFGFGILNLTIFALSNMGDSR